MKHLTGRFIPTAAWLLMNFLFTFPSYINALILATSVTTIFKKKFIMLKCLFIEKIQEDSIRGISRPKPIPISLDSVTISI